MAKLGCYTYLYTYTYILIYVYTQAHSHIHRVGCNNLFEWACTQPACEDQ